MKDSDMLWEFLPKGLKDIFEVVNVENGSTTFDVWLDEKREKSDEDKCNTDKERKRLLEWCRQALTLSKKQFATVVSTIKNNLFTIASYFRNRATNASAESFNAKVKLFRT